MKCRAKVLGFANGSRVRPGDVFDAKDCPPWAEPVPTTAPDGKPAPKPKEPETFSQLNKQDRDAARKLWGEPDVPPVGTAPGPDSETDLG